MPFLMGMTQKIMSRKFGIITANHYICTLFERFY